MQVFVNISSRGCFYSEELCPSAFTCWLELRWAPFLLRSQLLPKIGSIQILSYTLQRWSLVPIRDQSLAAQPGESFLSTLPWCGAQSMIQANDYPPPLWSPKIGTLRIIAITPQFARCRFGNAHQAKCARRYTLSGCNQDSNITQVHDWTHKRYIIQPWRLRESRSKYTYKDPNHT
jgi:hypothetical protein